MSDAPAAQRGSPNSGTAGRIGVLIPSLEGGGTERSMLNLAKAFIERGRKVDLVVCRMKGAYVDSIPSAARLVALGSAGRVRGRLAALRANLANPLPVTRAALLPRKAASEIEYIASLKNYILEREPDVVLSAMTYANLTALWAKHAAGSRVPVVVSERIVLSRHCENDACRNQWRWRYLPALVRQSYPRADAVVAVSHQVADDLAQITGLLDERITTIYNPVVDQSLLTQATEPLSHRWFDPAEPPVILGVGRLTEQKDFATLIKAFARVRACKDVRLVILGEGRQHQLLNTLVAELGLQGAVDMPGFVKNPFSYMAKAAMLVLSSKYEGLPGVLIQALACGCPVVSTDCPGGAAEILDDGRYGPLVSVGDVDALARAIDGVLKHPPGKAMLVARSQMFSVDQAASTYLDLLDKIVAAARPATGND